MLRRLLVLLPFVVAAAAQAETVRVPEDQPTLQDAVDAAGAGDTIQIAAGTYVGSVVVQDKSNLTIVAQGEATIDAAGADVGIRVTGGRNLRLTGVTVINAGKTGVLLESVVGARMTGCTVVGQGASSGQIDGIHVDRGTKVRLEDNEVRDVGGVGILLYHLQSDEDDPPGGAVKSVVRRNTITRTGNAGIALAGSRNVIDSNTITAAEGDGVDVFPEGSKNVIRNNTATGCRQGYRDEGTRNLWLNDSAVDAADDGWEVEGSSSKFVKCRSTGSDGSGLNVEDSGTSNLFVQFQASDSGQDAFDHGIEVRGTRNKFVRSSSAATTGNGLDVAGEGNSFSKCTSSAAAGDGFHVASDDNKLTACSASGSGGFDLFVDPGSSGNVVRGGSFATRN